MKAAVLVAAFLAGLLVGIGFSGRAQVGVSVFGLSRHSEPGFCEVNPGLGLNYSLSKDWRAAAIRYRNSNCNWSSAVGFAYCGLRWGDFCAGTAFMRVTGYSKEALYVPIPTISYERPKYAIDSIVAYKDGKAVIGIGVRFPW